VLFTWSCLIHLFLFLLEINIPINSLLDVKGSKGLSTPPSSDHTSQIPKPTSSSSLGQLSRGNFVNITHVRYPEVDCRVGKICNRFSVYYLRWYNTYLCQISNLTKRNVVFVFSFTQPSHAQPLYSRVSHVGKRLPKPTFITFNTPLLVDFVTLNLADAAISLRCGDTNTPQIRSNRRWNHVRCGFRSGRSLLIDIYEDYNRRCRKNQNISRMSLRALLGFFHGDHNHQRFQNWKGYFNYISYSLVIMIYVTETNPCVNMTLDAHIPYMRTN